MSSESIRSKERCSRCGAPVSVGLPVPPNVICVDCVAAADKAEEPAINVSLAGQPIEFSGDDILTIVCRLCHSSLLVNQDKVGTEIVCPDCHSTVVVERPKKLPKLKTGRPAPLESRKSFDPDAELAIEEPVERPKIDPTFGFDEVKEDLLSAPIPEAEIVPDNDSLNDADTAEVQKDSAENLTRRARYERLQKRRLAEGREKMRERARGKKSGKLGASEGATDDSSTTFARKKRRRRRGRKDSKLKIAGPAFGWMRQPSLLFGWVLVSAMLSFAYMVHADWGPVALLDRWFVKLNQSPLNLDVWSCLTSAAFVVGSIYLYYLCGRVFARNARRNFEQNSGDTSVMPSAWFTTTHFMLAWLLAGLPSMYWSVFVLPVQLLIAAPLLVGSWMNGSVWKFVRANGVILAEDQNRSSRTGSWRRLYGILAGAAVGICFAAVIVHYGGPLTVLGCLLMVGLLIGAVGECGWHCRQLSERLETPS